ncbi:4191_t:CDS:10 [Entrophospora sp. SA101]|nr:4191_t:CDS:10 [Entrophospora sp. SA101]
MPYHPEIGLNVRTSSLIAQTKTSKIFAVKKRNDLVLKIVHQKILLEREKKALEKLKGIIGIIQLLGQSKCALLLSPRAECSFNNSGLPVFNSSNDIILADFGSSAFIGEIDFYGGAPLFLVSERVLNSYGKIIDAHPKDDLHALIRSLYLLVNQSNLNETFLNIDDTNSVREYWEIYLKLAWLMLSDWAIKQLEKITHLHLNCPEETCYGVLAVHRICFALSLFHLILGLLVFKVNSTRDKRSSIQNGWWGPKILFWILLLVISFFIPNEFFMFWGNSISLIGAAIFILIGLVILIDCVHTWSEKCIEKWQDEESEFWKYLLIGSTLSLFIGSIALTGIITILSIHPVIQEENSRSGLSQASMVAFYCTYLILICNPLLDTANGTRVTTVVIGALFTFMAIAYSTSRAATQDITSGTRSGSLLAAVENGNTIQITGSDELVIIGRSLTSVWVKVVCSWICLLLYFWSLLAPVLLPERFEV